MCNVRFKTDLIADFKKFKFYFNSLFFKFFQNFSFDILSKKLYQTNFSVFWLFFIIFGGFFESILKTTFVADLFIITFHI